MESRSFHDGPPPGWDDVPPPWDPDDAPPAPARPEPAPPVESYAPPTAPTRPEAPAPAAAIADGRPIDGAALRRAWTGVLQGGEGLPPGMGAMLRAARYAPGEGRQVRLEFPPAHPAIERLAHPPTKKAVEDALARHLGGGAVTLAVSVGAPSAVAPGQSRITAESAKQDRLKRLMEGEPVLSAAVQAWDLELVD